MNNRPRWETDSVSKTESVWISRISIFCLTITRIEDENNRIRVVSMISAADDDWTIKIHERIFDFLSFVIPSDPESRLGDGSREEQKMLAFTELFLRHQIEHMLYPEHKEREVIQADVDFAQDRRRSDPTFYRMLRYALSDEMNGLRGGQYLALLDAAESLLPVDPLIGDVFNTLLAALGEFPDSLLQEVFPNLDAELKSRVLGEIYRRSRDPSHSLLHRTHDLRLTLKLFALLTRRNEREAVEVFRSFMDRWGLVDLLKELDLPETTVDAETQEELLHRFTTALYAHLEETSAEPFMRPPSAAPSEQSRSSGAPTRGLMERVEEARSNPAIPRQVIETIDKNKQNAIGHSGSKYSELIETLLAVPWGKIRKIQVSPEAFEAGLNRSHYGIQTPKEILCDFFSNLIWRYRRFTEDQAASWRRTGSAFLLVGPPGVGKTSLAISIAQNLGIPYHKISLGGMRDEADMRGHSFTYEGSKPGAIVQGLIKMQTMNGMFILDEADKTEKFANAGCRTVIIPRENLFGEGGIERLPEALREELQVLTYEEWHGEHPPFDYSRQILEAVAVDNIIQAARVAFIDDSELDALAVGFESHAREVARMLARGSLRLVPRLQVLQVKTPEEIDPGIFDATAGETQGNVHLLILPEIRDAVLTRLGTRQEGLHIIDFDPKQQKLSEVLQKILEPSLQQSASAIHLSLTAPYFLLKRDGIHPEAFPLDPHFQGISLFANNYAVQGIKIKRCKPVLNRVCSILALLEPAEIDACPFLARQDGIYVADLSFIPEKYRLDVHRAERILNRALTHWLDSIKRLINED